MSKVTPAVRQMASTVMRYGLAVFCVVAALLVTELLQHFTNGPPWFVFLAAVMISSWVAGLGPGLLAVLLSTLAVDYFFVPPLYILSLKIEHLPRLVLFGLSALLISWLSARRKRAETALRQARDELEARVYERTAELTRTNEQLQAEIAERTRAEREREQLLAREQAAHAEAVAAQHRFRDLVNAIEGVVWEAAAQTFQFLFISQQAEHILGYPVERWVSEPAFWREHIHPDDRAWAVELCVTATAEKRDHDFEYRMLAADGRSVWLRDLVTVVVEQGQATRLRGVMVDITARKRAEAALRERANLLDLTHDTVFVRDMGDVITYWNRGAEELYGWKQEEAIGQVSHRLTQTIFPAPLEAINAELLGTGRWEGELIHAKRDGTQVVVASRWSLQRDGQGNPIAVLETNNDITERRRAEEALRESEEQWRAVFEHNPTMYFMVDAAGTILSVNPFGAEQLGYTVEELVGHPVLNVFYEADREAVRRNVAACFAHLGRAMSWEFRKVRKDGPVIWVRETARAMLMKNRPIVLIVCEDITERKRAEEALKRTEQRLRAVIANAPIILFALDRAGVFTLSEGKGLDALGLEPGQVVGQSVFEVYRDAPQVLSAVRRALAGEPFTGVVDVNGLVFETHYIPVLDEGGQVAGVNGVAINITERKRAEEALRRSEAYLAEAQRLTHTGSWANNPAIGKVIYWSEEMFRIYGLDPQRRSAPDRKEFSRLLHPEDYDRVREVVEKAFREKADFEEDYRVVHPDGAVQHLHVIGHPVLDETGEVVEYVGTAVDVTERKRAEEERQAHLWFLERMDRVNRAIQGTNDLEQMMSDVLDALLTVFHGDRAWLVYPCDPQALWHGVKMQRTRPEFPSLFSVGLDVPVDPETADVLRTVRAASGPVRFGPGSPHPLPAKLAKRLGIRSRIVMALYPKGD